MLQRLCAVALLLTLAGSASAEDSRRAKGKPEAKKQNPCAVHGPGFTMVPGTTTCVRMGGSVQGDLSVGRGSAPNLGIK